MTPLERAALILQEEAAKPRSSNHRQYEAARADVLREALRFKSPESKPEPWGTPNRRGSGDDGNLEN